MGQEKKQSAEEGVDLFFRDELLLDGYDAVHV